jgi:folate-binding protein YgfZ
MDELNNASTHDDAAESAAGEAMFAAVLSSKGRTHFEMIIYPGASEQELLLEVDEAVAERVVKLFTRPRPRKGVDIAIDRSVHVLASINGAGGEPCSQSAIEAAVEIAGGTVLTCGRDARLPQFGERGLARSRDADSESGEPSGWLGHLDTLEPLYEVARTLAGLPERQPEVSGSVPLEWNLEQLAGVSFSKGCYLGQELVARAHFRGILRKRLVPVLVGSPSTGAAVAASSHPTGSIVPSLPGLALSPYLANLEAASGRAAAAGSESALEAATAVHLAMTDAASAGDRLPVSMVAPGGGGVGRGGGRLVSLLPGTNVGFAMMRLAPLLPEMSKARASSSDSCIGEAQYRLEGVCTEQFPDGVPVTAVVPPFWEAVEESQAAAQARVG